MGEDAEQTIETLTVEAPAFCHTLDLGKVQSLEDVVGQYPLI